jgi:hypothetical protein
MTRQQLRSADEDCHDRRVRDAVSGLSWREHGAGHRDARRHVESNEGSRVVDERFDAENRQG